MAIQDLKFNFTMRPITPCAVTSGNKLSSGIDFWVEASNIHVIKQRLFSKKLKENNLEVAFSDIAVSTDIAPDVKKFMSENGMTPSELSYPIQNMGIPVGPRREIKQIMQSAGRPFVPGSSIKGVIRTALLFDWLESHDDGKDALKLVVEQLLIHESKALEYIKANLKRKGDMKDKMLDLLASVFDESVLFGKNTEGKKDEEPYSRYLRLTDSECLPISRLGVYLLQRVRLVPPSNKRKTEKGTISMAVEALQPTDHPGDILQARMTVLAGELKLHKYLLSTLTDASAFKAMLNRFASANIREELHILRQCKDMNETVNKELISFYETCLEQINSGTKCFIRIGSGKTFYNNTLGLAILRHAFCQKQANEEGHLVKTMRAWEIWRALAWGVSFDNYPWPVTRTVVKINNKTFQPAGWMEVDILPQP